MENSDGARDGAGEEKAEACVGKDWTSLVAGGKHRWWRAANRESLADCHWI